MTELDLFIDWAKNQDLDVTIVDFSGAVKLIDKNGKQRDFCFEEFETDIAWLSWQAATQREGFKFVPINNTNIMDIIHGKCPCGSSRSPIASDKQGYNLIHCFSCGANKYIHEDY